VEELEQHVGIITNSPDEVILAEMATNPTAPFNLNMDDHSQTIEDLWDAKETTNAPGRSLHKNIQSNDGLRQFNRDGNMTNTTEGFSKPGVISQQNARTNNQTQALMMTGPIQPQFDKKMVIEQRGPNKSGLASMIGKGKP
jgi:hypothetical protein